jgi:hypothetical protein
MPADMEMLRLLCLLVVSAVLADRATYHNYQVRRVVPESQEQLKALKDLEDEPNGVCILCTENVYWEYQGSYGRNDTHKSKIHVGIQKLFFSLLQKNIRYWTYNNQKVC